MTVTSVGQSLSVNARRRNILELATSSSLSSARDPEFGAVCVVRRSNEQAC
jgi:hypothetical protein